MSGGYHCEMRKYALIVAGVLLSGLVVAQAKAPVKAASPNRTENRIVTRTIQPDVKYEFSRGLPQGKVKQVQKGTPGQIRTTFQVTFKDGKVAFRRPIFSTKIPSKPALFQIGRGGFTPSRGSFSGSRVMTMEATGYDPFPPGGSGTGKTASGLMARFGIVATDPRVVPLGTLVFVEGYGFGLAADTGGAIKGNKIDLCFNTRAEAYQWGRKKVRVHVFAGNEFSSRRGRG
jgi:3D (Asp-Asp-Asp) domain-containing protein